MPDTDRYRCPYAGCPFEGTDDEVNDHRATSVRPGAVHADQPQTGPNLRISGTRPR